MRFSTYESLIAWLVEKKINELMYSGIRGVEDFLKERTGFRISETDEEDFLLSFCIELRNIYTHNRGRVNETFLKRLAKYKHNNSFNEGKRLHAEFDDISNFSNNTLKLAVRLDNSISKKYKIPRKQYATWSKQKSPAK